MSDNLNNPNESNEQNEVKSGEYVAPTPPEEPQAPQPTAPQAPQPTVPQPTTPASDNGQYSAPVNPTPGVQQAGQMNEAEKASGMSIAALVLGIVGFLFGCCYGLGIIPGILAIVFGVLDNNKLKRENRTVGKGFNIAGIILGSIAILAGIIMIILLAVGFANMDMLQELESYSY